MAGPDRAGSTPHLDDEALSAVLDGESGDDDGAHADACQLCSRRLSELRAVVHEVGRSPAPADPRRREAALAAALAAWDATAGGAGDAGDPRHAEEAGDASAPTKLGAGAGAGAGGNDALLPDGHAAPSDAAVGTLAPSHRRRQKRWSSSPPRWLAAAAVVALLAAAVPVLRSLGGAGDEGQQTAAAPEQAAPEQPEQPKSAAAMRGDGETATDGQDPVQAPVDGGHLGALDRADLSSLISLVHQQVAASPVSAPAAATPDAPAADRAAPPDAQLEPRSCEADARRRGAGLGPLVYVARATVDDIPAVVLAFRPPERAHSVSVVVMAAGSCEPIASAP